MKSRFRHTCRELSSLFISVYSDHFQPFLGIFTLLNILPAFLYGCNAPQALPSLTAPVTRVTLTDSPYKAEELDIFTFRDDRLQKLDCYQKIRDPLSWNHEVVSTSGERIIVIFANSRKTPDDWAGVSSLAYMKEISVCLEDEDPAAPFMSGLAKTADEGRNTGTTLELRPMFSTVELRSIRCDFTGRPYAGESIDEVKVYLTNINAECRILDTGDILPSRIINAGKLREEDLQMMPDPYCIFREISDGVGRETIFPDVKLICYPNNSTTQGPGTPFTRLVIEGKISDETFYWPLDINRGESGYGIGRNERYIFDIVITRKGTKDPDIPVKAEDIEIIFNIGKWEEKEEYDVLF